MFVRDKFGNLVFVPRNACFVEAEGADAGAGGAAAAAAAGADAAAAGAGEGKGAEGTAAAGEGDAAGAGEAGKGKEGQQAAAEAEWRAGLTDPDLKKFADRSPDLAHLVKRAKESADRLSKAIVPPGKDADEDEIAAYRKAIGVPAKAEAYKFEMPKGVEPTDGDKAFHGKMAETFHALNITKAQAEGLNGVWNDLTAAIQAEQVAQDKVYAEESDTALRKSWGKDYDKNLAHAERAAAWAFGDDFEEMRALEGKDGRFMMDHPAMLKALATIGREMQEGGMAPPMSADAAEQAQDQLKDLQSQIDKAQSERDHKTANRLYQKKLELTAKLVGNKPIVGKAGRAA